MMTPGFCAGGADLLGAGGKAGGAVGTPILFRKVFVQIDRFTCIQMLWVFFFGAGPTKKYNAPSWTLD